jgi:hypothetical protein
MVRFVTAVHGTRPWGSRLGVQCTGAFSTWVAACVPLVQPAGRICSQTSRPRGHRKRGTVQPAGQTLRTRPRGNIVQWTGLRRTAHRSRCRGAGIAASQWPNCPPMVAPATPIHPSLVRVAMGREFGPCVAITPVGRQRIGLRRGHRSEPREGEHRGSQSAPERFQRSGLCTPVLTSEREPRGAVAVVLTGEYFSAQTQPGRSFRRRMATQGLTAGFRGFVRQRASRCSSRVVVGTSAPPTQRRTKYSVAIARSARSGGRSSSQPRSWRCVLWQSMLRRFASR